MWREAKDRKSEDARDKSFVASHRALAGAIKMPPANATRGAERNSIGTKADEAPEMAAQQASSRLAALRSQTNNWYEGLKKMSTIKDNRSKVF